MDAPRKEMRRREVARQRRFLTFSCYQRLPLFGNPRIRDAFRDRLAYSRSVCGFRLYAWVVMPEHVHLLLCPDIERATVERLLIHLKTPFARRVIGVWRERKAKILDRITDQDGEPRFWQRGGGYDRNVYTDTEFPEKMRYIHWNPVQRGLVEKPTEWEWSSAKWYAGEREGQIPMDEYQ